MNVLKRILYVVMVLAAVSCKHKPGPAARRTGQAGRNTRRGAARRGQADD